MSEWTKGPWRIDVNGSENWSVDYDGPSSQYMTICGNRKEPVAFAVQPDAFADQEIEANARLIAAAPTMAEALEPFATVLADVGQDDDDTDLYAAMSARNRTVPAITVGDLRRAAAALSLAKINEMMGEAG